jgi:hypothetical protein
MNDIDTICIEMVLLADWRLRFGDEPLGRTESDQQLVGYTLVLVYIAMV